MKDRTLVIGDTASWWAEWFDPNGVAIDFTQGARYGVLRIFCGSGIITKRTDNAADWVWHNKIKGEGYWTLSSVEAQALCEGSQDADAYFYDDATAVQTKHRCGQCKIVGEE